MHSYKKVFKVKGAVGYVIRVITLIFTRKYPTACAEIDKALFCEHETSPDFRKYPRIRLTFDTNSKSRICFLYRIFLCRSIIEFFTDRENFSYTFSIKFNVFWLEFQFYFRKYYIITLRCCTLKILIVSENFNLEKTDRQWDTQDQLHASITRVVLYPE